MLSGLFALTFLVSIPALLIGLVNPRWVMPKRVKQPTRKLAAKVYGGMLLASLFLMGATAGSDSTEVVNAGVEQSEVVAAPVASPASQPAVGLGISRAALQSRFESSEVGFQFENQPLADGRARVMGMSPSEMASLELIGEPDNLTQVTIMADVVDEQSRLVNALYFLGVLKLTVPGWDGSDWLSESMAQLASEDGEITTVQDGKQIGLSFHKNLGLLIMSVKPQA